MTTVTPSPVTSTSTTTSTSGRTVARAVAEARQAHAILAGRTSGRAPSKPPASVYAIAGEYLDGPGLDPEIARWHSAACEGSLRAAQTLAKRADRAADLDPEGALGLACLARACAWACVMAQRARRN